LRRDPLEVRKATLRSMLAKAGLGLRFNEHMEGDGPTVFAHACKLGLEGIVSKRLGSHYRSGRPTDWLKFKNPAAPAVKREAEEDWGKEWRGEGKTRKKNLTPETHGPKLWSFQKTHGAGRPIHTPEQRRRRESGRT